MIRILLCMRFKFTAQPASDDPRISLLEVADNGRVISPKHLPFTAGVNCTHCLHYSTKSTRLVFLLENRTNQRIFRTNQESCNFGLHINFFIVIWNKFIWITVRQWRTDAYDNKVLELTVVRSKINVNIGILFGFCYSLNALFRCSVVWTDEGTKLKCRLPQFCWFWLSLPRE
jgi:hypothetical protein